MCDLHFNPVTPIVPKLPLREEDVVVVKQKSTGGGGYSLRFFILFAILVLFIYIGLTSLKFKNFKLKRLIGR